MKLRRIIAAVLFGVMLTGCQSDENPQSSVAESVSATVTEVTTSAERYQQWYSAGKF